MSKQNKHIYISLMNRIAIALMVNQGALAALSLAFALLKSSCMSAWGDSLALDLIFRVCDCITYFLGFVIPVCVFNKMNNNAEKEIYEPVEDEKLPPMQIFFGFCLGLGMTALAAYVNYHAVNAIWDYSEFSREYLWSTELEYSYQIIIYFIYSAVIPAVVEELLFRGTVCKALGAYGKGTAIIVSAVLFALMHSNIEQILYAFVAGLFLGWLYAETKSIMLPILFHFINNAISAIGEMIRSQCSLAVYEAYGLYSNVVLAVLTAISLVGFLAIASKKGRMFNKLVLKPDENGKEVAPLSIAERASGFLTVGIGLFSAYSLITMIYYIYLSTLL